MWATQMRRRTRPASGQQCQQQPAEQRRQETTAAQDRGQQRMRSGSVVLVLGCCVHVFGQKKK
eukprot:COSAG01_NODE_11698_length_1877_cov_44.832958_2_plen_63_part_00